jgi:hypothetical protein
MKTVFITCCLLGTSLAFPWMRPEDAPDDFVKNAKRGLQIMKQDPELVALMQEIHAMQEAEKETFFSGASEDSSDANVLNKRAKSSGGSCLAHPMQDFLPVNITGLKRFPEAAYPYKDPKSTDQRGPCPGGNTLSKASSSYVLILAQA